MGGLTTYHLTLTHAHLFNGAIMLAPAIKNISNSWLLRTAKVLKALLPEKTRLTKPTNKEGSRNPKIGEKRSKDPLVNSEKHCLNTIHFILNQMDRVPQTFKNYKCPFLVIQGGIDKLVHPMGAF